MGVNCPAELSTSLKELRELVAAERYLIMWCPAGQTMEVISAFGFDLEKIFVSEALSLTLLERAASSGESRWSDQDAAQDGSITFMLAGIKSYMCVPVKFVDAGGVGLLYADDRKAVARFSFTDYTNMLNLSRRLSSRRSPGLREASAPLKPSPSEQRSASAPPPDSALPNKPMPIAQQVSFFRCLATFIQAGIPLLHGLHALGVQGETRRLQSFCNDLHRHLLRGNPLSDGCRKLGSFSPMVLYMLLCAEKSGQLAKVLSMLAEYLEESHARQERVRHAMVYPALVLSACLVMAVVLPTFVLRDQLSSYAHMGPLPWPTQVLVGVGNLARSPWTWGLVLGLMLLLPLSLRRLGRTPALMLLIHRFLLSNPITGRLYRSRQEVTLATALNLQLQAGVPLLEALRGSFKACDSPLIDEVAPQLIDQVRQGEPLAKVLKRTPGVGRPFCQMLRAGEESGHVVSVLEWVARAAKLDFDQSLDTAIRLIEPLVMLLMGVVVGVVTLGSLLPSLKLLENL